MLIKSSMQTLELAYDAVNMVYKNLLNQPGQMYNEWFVKNGYGQDYAYIMAEHTDYSVRLFFTFQDTGFVYVDGYFTNGSSYDRKTITSWRFDNDEYPFEETTNHVKQVLDRFFDEGINVLRGEEVINSRRTIKSEMSSRQYQNAIDKAARMIDEGERNVGTICKKTGLDEGDVQAMIDEQEELESVTSSRRPVKSGYSNNPDYVGDWFGKGQIDFDAIINPEDDGDVWMVKLWSGSGYVLDVYLCKANNIYEAMDIVFEWSYENEGHNKMVFDFDYISNECHDEFEKYPDYFGPDLSDDYEEFEMRWFEDYVSDDNGLYARSENFFVDKVPEDVLAENQEPVQNSRRAIKSGRRQEVSNKDFINKLKSMKSKGWSTNVVGYYENDLDTDEQRLYVSGGEYTFTNNDNERQKLSRQIMALNGGEGIGYKRGNFEDVINSSRRAIKSVNYKWQPRHLDKEDVKIYYDLIKNLTVVDPRDSTYELPVSAYSYLYKFCEAVGLESEKNDLQKWFKKTTAETINANDNYFEVDTDVIDTIEFAMEDYLNNSIQSSRRPVKSSNRSFFVGKELNSEIAFYCIDNRYHSENDMDRPEIKILNSKLEAEKIAKRSKSGFVQEL